MKNLLHSISFFCPFCKTKTSLETEYCNILIKDIICPKCANFKITLFMTVNKEEIDSLKESEFLSQLNLEFPKKEKLENEDFELIKLVCPKCEKETSYTLPKGYNSQVECLNCREQFYIDNEVIK